MTDILITNEDRERLVYLAESYAKEAEAEGVNPATLEVCQLQARLDYHERNGQRDRYLDTLQTVFKYINRETSEESGVIQPHTQPFVPGEGCELCGDPKYYFSDNGRKIDIRWGSSDNKILGSTSILNILNEEVSNLKLKFYEDSESENKDMLSGEWGNVVLAHIKYFTGYGSKPNGEETNEKDKEGVIKKFMKAQVGKLHVDHAVSVVLHALCEFSNKIYSENKPLESRFRTAAFSWARWYYQEAVKHERDTKSALANGNTRYKLKDRRTLNEFLSDFKVQLFREPTIEEICKGLDWGERRLESTFKMFDFNIKSYRPMNDEEMLYTIMDQHMTERQAYIIERNFGLGGVNKIGIKEISEDLDVSFPTIQRDRARAMEIIKEHLSFKYEN